MVERNKDDARGITKKKTWVTPLIESFNAGDATKNNSQSNLFDGTFNNSS